jgi:hypothetical protein
LQQLGITADLPFANGLLGEVRALAQGRKRPVSDPELFTLCAAARRVAS